MKERIYRFLLRLYPASFREEYGHDMVAAFRQQAAGGPAVWLGVLRDLFVHAPAEHAGMLAQDSRFALRSWRRTPLVAALAVLSLALAVGATAAIFSVVHAVLLRPLPFPEPDRLVRIHETNLARGLHSFTASIPNYASWRESVRSMELAAMSSFGLNLSGDGEPEHLDGYAFTASAPTLLGARLHLGRWFLPEEESPGRARVVVLSHALWTRRFGADPSILGRRLTLNGSPYEVIGVAGRDFAWPPATDLWAPLIVDPARAHRGDHYITAFARLRPGVSIEQASQELAAIASELTRRFPESNKDWSTRIEGLHRSVVAGGIRTALSVLFTSVLLVLSIACANIANLLLARTAGRRQEIAVRAALGAGAPRIVRQLLTESFLLALAGGVLGIGLAGALTGILRNLLEDRLPRADEIALSPAVLLFSLTLITVSALLFGMAPVLQRHAALGGSQRSVSCRASSRTRGLLVAGQISLATMLLIGAAMSLQSLLSLRRVQPGFDSSALLTGTLSIPRVRYPDPDRAEAFYSRVIESLETTPGIRAATFTSGIPLSSDGATSWGARFGDGPRVTTQWRMVSPNYFRAMSIPLLRGRGFGTQDRAASTGVAIVSLEASRRIFGGKDPVGLPLRADNGWTFQVVGVVADVALYDLADPPMPTMYFSTTQGLLFPVMKLAVRTSGDPRAMEPVIRRKIAEADPAMPLYRVRSMDEWLAGSAAQPRLFALLLGAFAVLALLLAAVGIYGVVSYAVGQRTREFGLRIAIGAAPAAIRNLVLHEGLLLSVGGAVAGVGGAWALLRVIEHRLHGVQPNDPAAFAAAPAALIAIALLACYIPARRATRVDPMTALRPE